MLSKSRILNNSVSPTTPSFTLSALDDCVEALVNLDVCILPTETVYGLACSALSEVAVQKVFKLKGRPSTNPLIVHVLSHDSAEEICQTNNMSKILTDHFWPGPLTLVLPKKSCIPHAVSAGLSSVAVRSPSHPVFRRVLEIIKIPLAAPSANLSNKLSTTTLKDAIDAFGSECPPIIDGGNCELGIESTVLDLTTLTPSILRNGPISQKQIENILDLKINDCSHLSNGSDKLLRKSPGQGLKHYSPNTPLFLHSSFQSMITSQIIQEDEIVIFPKVSCDSSEIKNSFNFFLSTDGGYKETAKNLYRTLRAADKLNKNKIHISLYSIQNESFLPINDRLNRASYKRV